MIVEAAIVAGITSVGRDAVSIGIVPTPAVACVTVAEQAAAGVMISASHNPIADNGIKFFGADGFKLPDAVEEEIEALPGIKECAVIGLDDPALEIALRSPAAFVGAMGSRRTQEARRERLRAAGMSEAEVARLAGPIGLDTGARTALETAVSILAEIVAVRYGRPGGRRTGADGPIHEVPA